MNFERKKIQLETLSEYLKEVRRELDFSLEAAATKARISPKFLESLEHGDFRQLPPDVYVVGFLRQIAETYGVEAPPLIAQYKKEKTISNQMEQHPAPARGRTKGLLGRVIITPKILSVSLGLIFVAVTLVYIVWQVASINKTPSLEIYQPEDRQVIKDSFVTIAGKTDPGAAVTVNGQDVFVGNDGSFQTQLGIESGAKQLKVVASNKFDKAVTKVISVVGETSLVASSTEVTLKLEFSSSVTITYSLDNAPGQTLEFHTGDTKVLVAQKKITVSTTDAGATLVTLNGQRLGTLGRPGEQLSNIPFFGISSPVK